MKKPVVFVVHNRKLIADTWVVIFCKWGFEVSAAYLGEDAVKAAAKTKPDVLFSDMFMPGLTGVEAGILIKNAFPDCRIILTSSWAGAGERMEEAKELGYEFEFMTAPVDPDELLRRLNGA